MSTVRFLWIGQRWVYGVAIVAGALFIGSLNVFPHLLAMRALGDKADAYAPYTLRGNYDNANVIGPRLHEVLEGNVFISDTDLYEYKDAPAFWPAGSESYAALARPFTDTVRGVLLITDFVFPALFFVLFFLMSYFLAGRNFFISLFVALLVSVYTEIAIHIPPPSFSFIQVFWNSINPFAAEPNNYLLIRRQSVIPGLLPMLLAFLFLLRTLQSPRVLYPLLGGFSFATLAYVYPYHFLYVATVCGIVFAWILALREYMVVKRLLLFGGFAFLLMIPFFINYFEVSSLAHYQEIFARFGKESGRSFNLTNWKRYLLCILGAWAIWRWGRISIQNRMSSIFLVAMLLASIVVLNLSLLLGFSIQPDHWLTRDIIWAFTFTYIVFVHWGFGFVRATYAVSVARACVALGVVLLVCVSINNVRASVLKSADTQDLYTLAPEDRSLFDWLNAHTQPEDVVLTPSLVRNSYIPLYTHNNIFIPRALNTMAPDSEIVDRLFTAYRIFDISPYFLKRMLVSDSTALPRNEGQHFSSREDEYYETGGSLYLFILKYSPYISNDDVRVNSRLRIPYDVADGMVKTYTQFSCGDACFSKYRVDYVVSGERERALTDVSLDEYQNLERVAAHDGWVVYKVRAH